jgi:hypothetical protein
MLTDVPIAARQQTVRQCVAQLRTDSFRDASGVAVVEDDRFLGLIATERLLTASRIRGIADLLPVEEVLAELATMPCDGAWPAERVAVFRRWIDAGKPA